MAISTFILHKQILKAKRKIRPTTKRKPIPVSTATGRHFTKAEKLFKTRHYQMAWVHYQLAIRYFYRENIDQNYLNKLKKRSDIAQKMLSENQTRDAVIEILLIEAEEYINDGTLDEALSNYKLALQQLENNKKDYAKTWPALFFGGNFDKLKDRVLAGLARVFHLKKDYSNAIEIYLKLVEKEQQKKSIEDRINYDFYLAECYYILATKTKNKQFYKNALTYFKHDLEDNLILEKQLGPNNEKTDALYYRIAKTHFHLEEYLEAIKFLDYITKEAANNLYYRAQLIKANAALASGAHFIAKRSFGIAKKLKSLKIKSSNIFLDAELGMHVSQAEYLYKHKRDYIQSLRHYQYAIDYAKLNCPNLVAFLSCQHLKISEIDSMVNKRKTGVLPKDDKLHLIQKFDFNGTPKNYFDIYEHLYCATLNKENFVSFTKCLVKNLVVSFLLGYQKAAAEFVGNIPDNFSGIELEQAIDSEVIARLDKINIGENNYCLAQSTLFEIYFFSRRKYITYPNFQQRFDDIKKAFEHLIRSCSSYDRLKKEQFVKLLQLDKCILAYHNSTAKLDETKLNLLVWRALINELVGLEAFSPTIVLAYNQICINEFMQMPQILRTIYLYRIISTSEIHQIESIIKEEQKKVKSDDKFTSRAMNLVSNVENQIKTILESNIVIKARHYNKSYSIDIDSKILNKQLIIFVNNENIEIMRAKVSGNKIVFIGYGNTVTINLNEKNLPFQFFSISNQIGGHRATKITGASLTQLKSFYSKVDQLVVDTHLMTKEFIAIGMGVTFEKELKTDLMHISVKGLVQEKESSIDTKHLIIENKPLIDIGGKFYANTAIIDGESIDLVEGSILNLENSKIKSSGTFKTRQGSCFHFQSSEIDTEDSIEVEKGGKWRPDTLSDTLPISSYLIVNTKKLYKMEGELEAGEFSLHAEEDHFDGHVKMYRKNNFRLNQNISDNKRFGFMVTTNKGYLSGDFEIPVGRFNRNHYAIHGAKAIPRSFLQFKKMLANRTRISSYSITDNKEIETPIEHENQQLLIEFVSPFEFSVNFEVRSPQVTGCHVLRADLFSKRSRERSLVFLPIDLSLQGLQNAYDDASYLMRMMSEHNFAAIRQEISSKLQLDNVIYWLVWLIRKLVPNLNSVANVTYALYNLAKQSRDIARKCKSLYEQWQRGIPIENYQLLELLYTSAPLAQLGIIAVSDGMILKDEGIQELNFTLPTASLTTLKNSIILTAQLLAPRQSQLGISDIAILGIKENPFTVVNNLWIVNCDFGKLMPSISQSSSSIYGFHLGGLKASLSVFEQAYISDSRFRVVFSDSFFQEAPKLLRTDETCYVWSNLIGVTTNDLPNYKDFFKRINLYQHLVASDYSLHIDNRVEFKEAYATSYNMNLTTSYKGPVLIDAPINANEFSLTSKYGDIINNSHISGTEGVFLCAPQGNIYNNCKFPQVVFKPETHTLHFMFRDITIVIPKKIELGWVPATIYSEFGNISLIAGNQVINTGDVNAPNGMVNFQGKQGVSVTALTRDITSHKTQSRWLGFSKKEITTVKTEVHKPIINAGDKIIFDAPNGTVTITGVSFDCNTAFYGKSISELPIIARTITKERSRILGGLLGGNNSTGIDQHAIPTVHHANSAIFITWEDNIVLDGSRIDVGFFKVKTPSKFVAKAPILEHSMTTTSWGFTPSFHIPIISMVQSIQHDVKGFEQCSDPISIAANSLTTASDTANGIHQVASAISNAGTIGALASIAPSASLSLNVIHTNEAYQTLSDSSIIAGAIQIEAESAHFEGVSVGALSAELNVPNIFISGAELQSSFQREYLGLSVGVSILGNVTAGINAGFVYGKATQYQHAVFSIKKLSLPNTDKLTLQNADLSVEQATGKVHNLSVSSNQDISRTNGLSLGLSSDVSSDHNRIQSMNAGLSDGSSSVTNVSRFDVKQPSELFNLKIENADILGGKLSGDGVMVNTVHQQSMHDHTRSFSAGITVNFPEAQMSQSESNPIYIPFRVYVEDQRSLGWDGHLKQDRNVKYNISLPIMNRHCFVTLSNDFRKISNFISLNDRVSNYSHKNESGKSEKGDHTVKSSKMIKATEFSKRPASNTNMSTNGKENLFTEAAFSALRLKSAEEIASEVFDSTLDSTLYSETSTESSAAATPKNHTIFPIQTAFDSLSDGYVGHAIRGGYRFFETLPSTLLAPFIFSNDLTTICLNKILNIAPKDSLFKLFVSPITQEYYDTALGRTTAVKDAFSKLMSHLADMCVVAGTIPDSSHPLPLSDHAIYQDTIRRWEQTESNFFDGFAVMSGPERTEAMTFMLASLLMRSPASFLEDAQVIRASGSFVNEMQLSHYNQIRIFAPSYPPIFLTQDYVYAMVDILRGKKSFGEAYEANHIYVPELPRAWNIHTMPDFLKYMQPLTEEERYNIFALSLKYTSGINIVPEIPISPLMRTKLFDYFENRCLPFKQLTAADLFAIENKELHTYNYAIEPNGHLLFNDDELPAHLQDHNDPAWLRRIKYSHADLTKNSPVLSAGEFTISDDGLHINNFSGHYLPQGDHLIQLTESVFAKYGLIGKMTLQQHTTHWQPYIVFPRNNKTPLFVAGGLGTIPNIIQAQDDTSNESQKNPLPHGILPMQRAFDSLSNGYLTHAVYGGYRSVISLPTFLMNSFRLMNDLATLGIREFANVAPEDSLADLYARNISSEDYDISVQRITAIKNAFSQLVTHLADMTVFAGTIGNPTHPLPPSDVDTYLQPISRWNQTVSNVIEQVLTMPGPEKAETLTFLMTSLLMKSPASLLADTQLVRASSSLMKEKGIADEVLHIHNRSEHHLPQDDHHIQLTESVEKAKKAHSLTESIAIQSERSKKNEKVIEEGDRKLAQEHELFEPIAENMKSQTHSAVTKHNPAPVIFSSSPFGGAIINLTLDNQDMMIRKMDKKVRCLHET